MTGNGLSFNLPRDGPISIEVSGTFFTGGGRSVERLVGEMNDAIQHGVAAQALADTMMFLDQQIQHPTPYYETRVELVRRSGSWAVTDNGVIYGPWLEGVSERNKTTSFKGYASFRKGMQETIRKLPALLETITSRFFTRG